MKEKILVIVAHPDDEILGCGGYLSKYKNKKIFKIIFIGEGTTCRYSGNLQKKAIQDVIQKRQKDAIKALNFLRIKKYSFYNLPCGRFDTISIIDINKIIENEIKIFQPNIILTHCSSDCNNDHRIIHRSVMMATRLSSKNSFLKKILSFEILSSTEWNFEEPFNPNYFELLSLKNVNEKVRAFNFYKSEIQKKDMPRNRDGITTLAKYRGKIISKKYAEAYKIVRFIS